MLVSEGNGRRSLGNDELTYDRGQAPSHGRRLIRVVIVGLVIVAVMLVAALVSFIVLSSTPMFTIAYIDTESTEHLSAENIAKLASVEEGTTLLTIDEDAIVENLKRNPWVGDVQLIREFPDKLKIVVTERTVDCLVKMSTASVCWCLGNDNVWIEPINLTIMDGQSADDAALALAREMDSLLIIDVPTSLSPTAGESTNEDALMAVATYRQQFSKEFADQIVRFSAASVESIGCTLSNGVEVSLGAPVDIDVKEAVIKEILDKHPNQITYINVRVPSQPSYRRLGSESVTEGTGVTVGEHEGANDANPADSANQNAAQDDTQSQDGQQNNGQASSEGSPATSGDESSTGVAQDEYEGEAVADESYDDGSYYDDSEYYDDSGYYEESYDDGYTEETDYEEYVDDSEYYGE